jgi:hypothetical protein
VRQIATVARTGSDDLVILNGETALSTAVAQGQQIAASFQGLVHTDLLTPARMSGFVAATVVGNAPACCVHRRNLLTLNLQHDVAHHS